MMYRVSNFSLDDQFDDSANTSTTETTKAITAPFLKLISWFQKRILLRHILHGPGWWFQRPRFKLQKLLALIDRAPWRSSATSRPLTPSWPLRRQLDELMPTQPRILPRPLQLLTLTDRPCMRSSAVARLLSHSTMELPRQIRLPRYPHLSSYHQFPCQHWIKLKLEKTIHGSDCFIEINVNYLVLI